MPRALFPRAEPCRLTGAPIAVGTLRLSDQCLYRLTDTAEDVDHDQHEPLHSAHSRERTRGNSAHEPHIGQVQDDLHRAVCHQWHGECQDRQLTDVGATRAVEALRRSVVWLRAATLADAAGLQALPLPYHALTMTHRCPRLLLR